MEHTLIPSFMFLIPPPPPYPLRSACFPIHILAPSLLSIHSLKVNIYRRLCVQRAITTNLHLSSRYHNTIPNEVLLPAIRCLPPFFYSFTLCVLSNSCVHALCNLNHVIALPPPLLASHKHLYWPIHVSINRSMAMRPSPFSSLLGPTTSSMPSRLLSSGWCSSSSRPSPPPPPYLLVSSFPPWALAPAWVVF